MKPEEKNEMTRATLRMNPQLLAERVARHYMHCGRMAQTLHRKEQVERQTGQKDAREPVQFILDQIAQDHLDLFGVPPAWRPQ